MDGRAFEDSIAGAMIAAFVVGGVAVLTVIALWYFVLSHVRIGWV